MEPRQTPPHRKRHVLALPVCAERPCSASRLHDPRRTGARGDRQRPPCERRQTRGRDRTAPRRQRRRPTGPLRRHQHGNRGVTVGPTGCGIGVQRVDGLLHRQRPAVRTRLEHRRERVRDSHQAGGHPGCCAMAPTSALHAALSSAVPTPIRSDTAPGMRPSPPCLRLSTHTSLPPASHPRPADSAIRAPDPRRPAKCLVQARTAQRSAPTARGRGGCRGGNDRAGNDVRRSASFSL